MTDLASTHIELFNTLFKGTANITNVLVAPILLLQVTYAQITGDVDRIKMVLKGVFVYFLLILTFPYFLRFGLDLTWSLVTEDFGKSKSMGEFLEQSEGLFDWTMSSLWLAAKVIELFLGALLFLFAFLVIAIISIYAPLAFLFGSTLGIGIGISTIFGLLVGALSTPIIWRAITEAIELGVVVLEKSESKITVVVFYLAGYILKFVGPIYSIYKGIKAGKAGLSEGLSKLKNSLPNLGSKTGNVQGVASSAAGAAAAGASLVTSSLVGQLKNRSSKDQQQSSSSKEQADEADILADHTAKLQNEKNSSTKTDKSDLKEKEESKNPQISIKNPPFSTQNPTENEGKPPSKFYLNTDHPKFSGKKIPAEKVHKLIKSPPSDEIWNANNGYSETLRKGSANYHEAKKMFEQQPPSNKSANNQKWAIKRPNTSSDQILKPKDMTLSEIRAVSYEMSHQGIKLESVKDFEGWRQKDVSILTDRWKPRDFYQRKPKPTAIKDASELPSHNFK